MTVSRVSLGQSVIVTLEDPTAGETEKIPCSPRRGLEMKKMLLTVAVLAVFAAAVFAVDYPPEGQTTGTTPLDLNPGPTITPDSVCRVPMFVLANDHNGNSGQWYWFVAARRTGTDTPVIAVGTPDVKKTLGAASWTATLSVSGDQIRSTVTGGLGQTVDWMQINDEAFCMTGTVP